MRRRVFIDVLHFQRIPRANEQLAGGIASAIARAFRRDIRLNLLWLNAKEDAHLAEKLAFLWLLALLVPLARIWRRASAPPRCWIAPHGLLRLLRHDGWRIGRGIPQTTRRNAPHGRFPLGVVVVRVSPLRADVLRVATLWRIVWRRSVGLISRCARDL